MKVKEETLQEEYEAYEAAKPELLKSCDGKFVVFKLQDSIGPFDDIVEAYTAGLKKWGLVPMLVQKVQPVEESEDVPSIM